MATIDPADHAKLATIDPTGCLFNEDLVPAKARRWPAYSLFALWMSDAHNIGDYTFATGLFLLGLSAWQVTLGILLGILVIFAGCTLMGFIGHSTGVPYPVVSRMSFGLFGANFLTLVRAVVAIGWYGIQTSLASVAITVLLLRLDPSLGALGNSWAWTRYPGSASSPCRNCASPLPSSPGSPCPTRWEWGEDGHQERDHLAGARRRCAAGRASFLSAITCRWEAGAADGCP